MSSETILNNRYVLQAQQGSGGMSVIYKAKDLSLGRVVAVKILRPSLTKDPSFLDKFKMEARSVANLSHPNIVTVHDVGNDGPTHYIVMEMVEGEDLKKIIKARGALPIDLALNLSIQICAGIGFAHRSNLVHADVKPQNILVTPENVVKVTDFGIAQALSDTQPQQRADVVWGSPHYFAPEQARGERPSPASDVYSIGIVMFEMLSGRLPYVGTNQQELAMAHIKERVPMVTEFNPTVPEALAKIIFKVMSKEPSARYQMADQLGRILQEYQDRSRDRTVSGPAVPPSPAQAPRPPVPRADAPPAIPPPPPTPSPQSSEPTARYSAAPSAPQQYDPRRPSVPSPSGTPPPPQPPITSPPQPMQQSYTPPPPTGDTGGYTPSSYSAPLHHTQPEPEEDGLDIVTIALVALAFIAVAGLIPLYIVVWQARIGG